MAHMVCFFEIKLQNARCDCRTGNNGAEKCRWNED